MKHEIMKYLRDGLGESDSLSDIRKDPKAWRKTPWYWKRPSGMKEDSMILEKTLRREEGHYDIRKGHTSSIALITTLMKRT